MYTRERFNPSDPPPDRNSPAWAHWLRQELHKIQRGIPHGSWIDARDFGVRGVGQTSATADDTTAFNRLWATVRDVGAGVNVVIPKGNYGVSGTMAPEGSFNLHAEGVTFTAASSGGTWTSVLDNTGVDTGLDAFFDILLMSHSTISGRITFDGNSVANLAGMTITDPNRNTGGGSGNVLWEANTIVKNFERGLYGPSDGQGFIGWKIPKIRFDGNGYHFYGVANSIDDMWIGVMRCQGTSAASFANKAGIYLERCSGLSFGSLFLRGDRTDWDGLILNNGSVKMDHLFMEGTFNHGVKTDGNGYKIIIDNLALGKSVFTTTHNAAIRSTNSRGYIRVGVNGENVSLTPTLTAIVSLNGTAATQQRTTIVDMPFGSATKMPFSWSSGSNPSGQDIAIAYTSDGVWHEHFNGTSRFHWIEGQEVTATLAAGNNNNYDPGAATMLRLSGDGGGTSDITGIAGGAWGRQLRIVNVSANSFTISTSGTESTAANRVVSGTGADITLAENDACTLVYDYTSSRWRVFSVVT